MKLTFRKFCVIFLKDKQNFMNNYIFSLFFSLVLFATPGEFSLTPALELAPELAPALPIAYYSFNDCDAFDESENSSHGKLFGNIDCHCGVEGEGLLFDGKDDYIEFQGEVNNYFNTSDFTISFYFRPFGKTVFKQSMLSKRTECTEDFMLDILLDQNTMEVVTEFHQSEHKDYPGISPTIEKGQWYHFALVRNSFRAYTYINGELMLEGRRCSGVDISNETPLSFGNSPCLGSGARRFKGVLDELRIFDKALDHDAIYKLYQMYPVELAELDCVS